MTPSERLLIENLPRPQIDPSFSSGLLLRILSEQPVLSLVDPCPASRIRIHHVGGVMGAVVLAVGAAMGWKALNRRGEAA